MKHLFIVIIALALFTSCTKHIEQEPTITKEVASTLPTTLTETEITTELKIVEKTPVLATYLPKGVQVISTAGLDNTNPIHIFRRDAYTTLSLRQLEMTSETEANRYMKEILGYSAKNVKLQDNGFYAGESKGTYQQAKLIKINGNYYMWMVDCIEFQKDKFLPIVDIIVNNTQFIK